MPQGPSARQSLGRGTKDALAGEKDAIGGADQYLQQAAPFREEKNRRSEADGVVLDCILANTKELKKLAMKAGFLQIALILEMAELEASEQAIKIGKRAR